MPCHWPSMLYYWNMYNNTTTIRSPLTICSEEPSPHKGVTRNPSMQAAFLPSPSMPQQCIPWLSHSHIRSQRCAKRFAFPLMQPPRHISASAPVSVSVSVSMSVYVILIYRLSSSTHATACLSAPP
ncbi:hypothetical protein B484DRAFT_200097 [Ochromonadaceae sp. CCMP2298]|nr:hypothetical protein B484DRAFT_200097 [Ochromonadaceae sp. CCMP2298]